jgi:RHS repeat-associated protein
MQMPDRCYSDGTTHTTNISAVTTVPVHHMVNRVWPDGRDSAIGGAIILTSSSPLGLVASGGAESLSYKLPSYIGGLLHTVRIFTHGTVPPGLRAEISMGGTSSSTTSFSGISTDLTYTPTSISVPYLHIYNLGMRDTIFIDSVHIDSATYEPYHVLSSISSSDGYAYGFNGQMKVNEWAGSGNHVDYGDRGYDTRTARWPTLDKLFKNYPSLSPYSFCADNPILFVDRGGQKIFIYYIDENGKNMSYQYGSKVKVPDNSFVQNVVASLDRNRIVNKNTQGAINRIATTTNKTLNLVESKQGSFQTAAEIPVKDLNGNLIPQGTAIDPSKAMIDVATIPYNPFAGLSNNAGTEAISPSTTLMHEIGHVYSAFFETSNYLTTSQTPDPQYEDAQERFATTILEHAVAQYYGEWIRTDHSSGREIMTSSPMSNVPVVTSESQLGQGQSFNLPK